jgi:uncharacterized membrane protein
MKKFIAKLRDIAMAGFFFLLPVYVMFVIIAKAWKSLSSVGASIAGMFGLKSILGVAGATAFSWLLIITSWITFGLLARFSFATALNRAVEKTLAKYIPGYDTYKALAEEKLHHRVKTLPYTSALIKQQEYWQPAFIVEQDGNGNLVVFLPDTPETSRGHILLAKHDQVRIVSSVTANQFDAMLKKLGKGLLSEHGISISGSEQTPLP